MRALRFDRELKLIDDEPIPSLPGESLVRVLHAGICNTDLEITRGYAGFTGIPGHEFVGIVAESRNGSIVGKRVVGEINAGCGRCPDCRSGDQRHCLFRTVLGIKNRSGAFAEFLSLPDENLIEVPDSISNLEAVFVEPLAAACRILNQVDISASSNVAVVGDGKLAQLIIMVLRSTGCRLTVLGKHEPKLELASKSGALAIKIHPAGVALPHLPAELAGERFDVVVEASGSPAGLELGLNLVRPRGVLVLKSTHHGLATLDTSLVVVNEVIIVGSRCGLLAEAIELLSKRQVDVKPLVTRCMPLSDWETAFAEAASPSSLKIVLDISQVA